MDQRQLTRECRIAPELRRCCWYGLAGMALLAVTFYCLERFFMNGGNGRIAVGLALFACVGWRLSAVLRWRLIVAADGIMVRRWFGWDCWPWTDFASGRIVKAYAGYLVDPARPWWRRRLCLAHLSEDDRKEVIAAINAHYQLPPAPVVADTLRIKYGFRRSAVLDRNGIELLIGGRPSVYLWSDVRLVHIVREDPLRRDFRTLTILLPDQDIELKYVTHEGGTTPTWRGASNEEINEFLLAHLTPDQIETTLPGQPLKDRALIEKELEAAKKQQRKLRVFAAFSLTFLVGWLAYSAIAGIWVKGALLSAMFVVPWGPVFWYLDRMQRDRIRELEEMLDAAGSLPLAGSRNEVWT